jgi:hypothetical protein
MPLVEAAVKERLGTSRLPAKMRSGVLYTEAYDRTQTARLRGVLAAVTRPGQAEGRRRGERGRQGLKCVFLCVLCVVSLGEVVSRYGLDEGMVEEAVASLVKQGLLQGSLKGRDYMPTSFR